MSLQLCAALVQRDRIFKLGFAAFKLGNNVFQLGERFFEGQGDDVICRFCHWLFLSGCGVNGKMPRRGLINLSLYRIVPAGFGGAL